MVNTHKQEVHHIFTLHALRFRGFLFEDEDFDQSLLSYKNNDFESWIIAANP